MNPIDYVLVAGILILAVLAMWFYFRRKKAGKNCSGGCGGCPYAENCPSSPPRKDPPQ